MKIHGDGAFVLFNNPHNKAIWEVTEMFKNPRYCTKGISETVPLLTQIILWDLIDSMEVEKKDYLQVFKLTTDGTTQHVTHTQEQPPYERTLEFRTDNPITARVIVKPPMPKSSLSAC